MKIVFDRDICEGNAVCIGMAPDYFGLDDDGKAIILEEVVAEASEDLVSDAVAMCPVAALRLTNRKDRDFERQ